MTGSDGPQPVRAGEVRRALVEDQRGAQQQRPADGPGTHHPAQVREPEESVAGAKVEVVGEVLGGLDGEAAMDVDRALGPAGRARGVDDHVRRLRIGRRRLAERLEAGGGQRLVPPVVATRRPWHVAGRRWFVVGPIGARPSHASDDQDLAHGRRHGHGRVGSGLELDDAAATSEAVGRDEQGGVAIRQAGGDGFSAVAREDRREDGLQLAQGEHGDDRLDQHRQQDPDAITGPHPVRPEHRRRQVDRLAELQVAERPDLVVLSLPHERGSIGLDASSPIHRRRRMVEGAAAPPCRPFDASADVHRRTRRALPVERKILHGRGPEPGRVDRGPGLQGLEVGLAGRRQEARQAGPGGDRWIRTPGDIWRIAAEDRPAVGAVAHPVIVATAAAGWAPRPTQPGCRVAAITSRAG